MIPPSKQKSMNDDFNGFMHQLKREFKENEKGVREVIYDTMESLTYAVAHLQRYPEQFQAFLKDAYFKRNHIKPKSAGPAVLMFMEDASTKNSREKYSRRGRAIEALLARGAQPHQIAAQLSAQGGIMGVLDGESAAENAEDSDDHESDVEDEDDEVSFDDERDDADSIENDDDNSENGRRKGSSSAERTYEVEVGGRVAHLPIIPGYSPLLVQVPDADLPNAIKPGMRRLKYDVARSKGFKEARAKYLDGKKVKG